MNNEMTGPERAKLAGVLLGIGGVLNIIYGIAGIGHAKVFASNQHYFFGGLKSWGWAALILGVLELMAAMSLFRGGEFGRWFGIVIGSLAAIEALLQLPSYPLWSVAIFGLSLWIVQGLTRPVSTEELWQARASGASVSVNRGELRPPT
jgi:type IV secretory pathway TrbD component